MTTTTPNVDAWVESLKILMPYRSLLSQNQRIQLAMAMSNYVIAPTGKPSDAAGDSYTALANNIALLSNRNTRAKIASELVTLRVRVLAEKRRTGA